jgi:hypothetical protein
MDDDYNEKTGMLINFNYGEFILIREHLVQTRYVILTYNATILQIYTLSNSSRIYGRNMQWDAFKTEIFMKKSLISKLKYLNAPRIIRYKYISYLICLHYQFPGNGLKHGNYKIFTKSHTLNITVLQHTWNSQTTRYIFIGRLLILQLNSSS